jgi:hypothetical protein
MSGCATQSDTRACDGVEGEAPCRLKRIGGFHLALAVGRHCLLCATERWPGPAPARGQQCILSYLCRTLRPGAWSGQRGGATPRWVRLPMRMGQVPECPSAPLRIPRPWAEAGRVTRSGTWALGSRAARPPASRWGVVVVIAADGVWWWCGGPESLGV